MEKKLLLVIIFISCFGWYVNAQVGIGTVTPDPSAILDIQSTTQGFLAPRMTSVERLAIATPAQGLLVYDTDENYLYFYNSSNSTWERVLTSHIERDNYVLVKSESDFPAPSGGSIVLDPGTLYEINGAISLSNPINLNGAYIEGVDSNEDKLIANGGTVFSGAGGSVRNITLSAPSGTIFNLDGQGSGSFVMQSSIVTTSASVGTIANFNLVFMNVIQYISNNDGLEYRDVDQLLLNNQGWFGNNQGTYETFTGDFNLIEKVSGFSQVLSATGATAVDVTGVSNLAGDGILQSVVFYGGGNYINGNSPYNGYNFTKDWAVVCEGIPVERDENASGNFYYNGSLTSGFAQAISANTSTKITGDAFSNTTTANSLFRFTAPAYNMLVYDGSKTRDMQVNASLSIRVTGATGDFYAFIIAKNGAVITESNSVVRINNDSDIQNVALNSIVTMTPGDYIELYVQRLTGNGSDDLVIFSENLSVK